MSQNNIRKLRANIIITAGGPKAEVIESQVVHWANPLICSCGATIPDDDICYTNGCNEEGEEYSEISAACVNCQTIYDRSTFMHMNSLDEAKKYMQEFIND